MKVKLKAEHWVALLTFLLGFCVWLVCAIKHNTLWITSPADFPLVKTPTLLIGDGLLLPFFNYRFVKLLRASFDKNWWRARRGKLIVIGIALFLLSIGINSVTHYLWSHDAYSGTIDAPGNQLSFAGWWHYFFSIAEMSVLFFFIVHWFSLGQTKNWKAFRYATRSWYIIIAFTSVTIIDFTVLLFSILDHPDILAALKVGWITLVPIISSTTVLLLMRRLDKQHA